MKRQLIKKTLFTLLLGMATSVASAGPLITDWNFTVSAAFDTTIGATTFTAGGGCQDVSALAISWGDAPCGPPAPDARSGIDITNSPAAGTVHTNGPAVLTNTYTHHNNPISGTNATLLTATVLSTLTLTPTLPAPGPTVGPVTATFGIKFAETPNAGPCAASSPVGNPCNDIFVVTGSLNNAFTMDGNTYFVSFFDSTNALNPLPDSACIAALASPGCLGLTTAEGQSTPFTFAMLITTDRVRVPEPFMIGLFGLGLLGMGLQRRKSK